LKLTARLAINADPLFIRLVASNPTGFVLKIDKYVEINNQGRTVFKCLTKSANKGFWDGLDTQTPYETSQKFEIQRAEAMASSDTLYVYDWPELFESATEKLWLDSGLLAHPERDLEDFFECKELIMHDSVTQSAMIKGWTAKDAEERGYLMPIVREAGKNDCGMVAWHLKLRTPEYPQGRELVVICNDITFQAGSFGTKEDIFFFKVNSFLSLFVFVVLFNALSIYSVCDRHLNMLVLVDYQESI
jgi:acetyl-CoA carboxylase/biotin carboxylase 1